MGLKEMLARWAVRRPHVLLVPVPGFTAARLAVEATVSRVGGVLAAGPADADVLVVAGEPGAELAEVVERVWAQLPGPRSRVQLVDPGQADDGLRGAVAALADPQQAADAAARGDEWEPGDEDMPGGLPMAGMGPDRDGLMLEVLHLPLGPVLPDWPAGLVVDTAVQGDVVQQAHARLLGPAGAPGMPFWHVTERRAAAQLDSLARLLAVAGWGAAAVRARRLRDDLLDGVPVEQIRPAFDGLRRRLQHSRALRLATDGLGVLDADAAARAGVGGPAARAGGDATARWRQWLAETEALLAGQDPAPGEDPRGSTSEPLLSVATEAMVGQELAAARLLLASFDPDPDELATLPTTMAGGTG
jgi:hypothetical protein